jgi:hypothetical protein
MNKLIDSMNKLLQEIIGPTSNPISPMNQIKKQAYPSLSKPIVKLKPVQMVPKKPAIPTNSLQVNPKYKLFNYDYNT